EPTSQDKDRCTTCEDDEISLRWVIPDVNGTGEVEIQCMSAASLAETTVRVKNLDNGEVACGRVGSDSRMRVALPSTAGDRVVVDLFDGMDVVDTYDADVGCNPLGNAEIRQTI